MKAPPVSREGPAVDQVLRIRNEGSLGSASGIWDWIYTGSMNYTYDSENHMTSATGNGNTIRMV